MNEYVCSFISRKLGPYRKPILQVEHLGSVSLITVVDDSPENRHSVGRHFDCFFQNYPDWIVTTDLELAKMAAYFFGAPIENIPLYKIEQWYVSNRFQYLTNEIGWDWVVGDSVDTVVQKIESGLLGS